MLSLWKGATTEEKTAPVGYGPTPSHVPLKTANYPRTFGLIHQDTSQPTKTTNRRRGKCEWYGVTGSLTSASIAATSESALNLKRSRLCHKVSNQLRGTDVTLLGTTV